MKQHIRELYKSGLSTRKVAELVEVSYPTVYRWCKDIIRSKSESLQGDKHPFYKGGHRVPSGHIVIWVNGKLRYEHRVIMEKHLARKLDKKEIVHHINHKPADNRIENLEITNLSDHTRYHNLERYASAHN